MKRVGIIIGQLSWGGAERQIYELATRLHGENFEPIIYCLSEDIHPYSGMLTEKGIEVRIFPRGSHFDLKRVWQLRSQMHRDRIDIAHSWLIDDDAYNALAHVAHRRPWIASMRSRLSGRDPLRKRIDRWVFRRAPLVIVNEREVIDFLEREFGCNREKIRLIPNGIDLQRLQPNQTREEIRIELQAALDSPVILFAGRLEREKRIDRLIEAFVLFRKEMGTGYLWIAGDGSRKAPLTKLTADRGVADFVRFTGVRPDLPNLLNAADLFALCSESEGLPNVVLEAMGCGLPVLVTPECGCSDLVRDEYNGWLAPDSEPKTLASRITSILNSPEDRLLVAGQAWKTIQERYSVERMVSNMAQIYRELLA